jgi:hypothetical protein
VRSAGPAFEQTVLQPLRALYSSGFSDQIIIVVDALDETARLQESETIVTLLANMGMLLAQVRWLITTRPEDKVLRHFEARKLPRVLLDADRPDNLGDIKAYARQQFSTDPKLRKRVAFPRFVRKKPTMPLRSKGNQPHLLEDIQKIFQSILQEATRAPDTAYVVRQSTDHGRDVIRQIWTTSRLGTIRNQEEWEDLRTIGIAITEL